MLVAVGRSDRPARSRRARARRAAFRSSSRAPTTRRVAAPSSSRSRSGSAVPPTPKRSRSAFAPPWRAARRPAPVATDRVERVEYEQMLHDSLTGLPTLPVMIERSRALFKERGELDGALPQLRALLEDRGDLRLGEARRGARDDGGGGARVPRRHGAQHVARDGELHQRRRLHLLPRAGERRRGGDGGRDHRDGVAPPAPRRRPHRGAARRGHRGAVRHLRRPRARLLQPEDPARATDLSRHSRSGERVALDRGARARAARGRSARRACATAPSTSTTTRSSSPKRARSSATRRWRAA